MANVEYLPEAIEDLHRIWRHVHDESQSIIVANRLVDSIDDAAQVYATQPQMGSLRPDLAPKIRCFPVSNYVVFYLPRRKGIEVIQIIHGARDIPFHFRGIRRGKRKPG